jgi:hypothetical protein
LRLPLLLSLFALCLVLLAAFLPATTAALSVGHRHRAGKTRRQNGDDSHLS